MISDALNWLFARFGGNSMHALPEGNRFVVVHKDQVVAPVLGTTQVREHHMADLTDFAAFVNRRLSSVATDVLFDTDSDVITADGGPSDRRSDALTCGLRLHPRWKRWNDLLGKKLDQRAFYRHLLSSTPEDSELLETPNGQVIGRAHLVIAQDIGTLKITKGATFVGELDPRGFYRLRSNDATVEASAKIPSSLEIRVPWYQLGAPVLDNDGQPADARGATYAITLEIEVITDGATPLFVLTAPGLDLVKHAAQIDAVNLLRDLLDDGFLVGLGRHGVELVHA